MFVSYSGVISFCLILENSSFSWFIYLVLVGFIWVGLSLVIKRDSIKDKSLSSEMLMISGGETASDGRIIRSFTFQLFSWWKFTQDLSCVVLVNWIFFLGTSNLNDFFTIGDQADISDCWFYGTKCGGNINYFIFIICWKKIIAVTDLM